MGCLDDVILKIICLEEGKKSLGREEINIQHPQVDWRGREMQVTWGGMVMVRGGQMKLFH